MTKDRQKLDDAPPGLVKRGNWFHYSRTINGERVNRPLKTKNFAHACKLVIEINQRIEDKKQTPALAVNPDGVSFMKAAEAYLECKNLQPSTRRRYKAIIEHIGTCFVKITGVPNVKLVDVTRGLVQDYAQLRKTAPTSRNGHKNGTKTTGVSDKTLNCEVQFIKGVLKFSVGRDWLAAVPNLDGIAKFKKQRGQPSEVANPLDDFEIKALLRASEEYDKVQAGKQYYPNYFSALIQTFLYTGLRMGEMEHLVWSDIDFINDTITLKAKSFEVNGETINWRPKATQGTIPLYAQLKTVLLKLQKQSQSPLVFPNNKGLLWKRHFSRHLNKMIEIAGINKSIRPHDLRHTFAVSLRRQGIGIETIKELMRHANIEETLIYAKYDLEEGRKAMAKLPDFFS